MNSRRYDSTREIVVHEERDHGLGDDDFSVLSLIGLDACVKAISQSYLRVPLHELEVIDIAREREP